MISHPKNIGQCPKTLQCPTPNSFESMTTWEWDAPEPPEDDLESLSEILKVEASRKMS